VLEPGTLLDGAMGTALLARGLPDGALPEEWVLSRPTEVAAVHAGHAAAGARVVLTNTFNAAAPRLEARLAPAEIETACRAAVRLARGAAPGAKVAGCLGPTGLAGPGRTPPGDAALRARYDRPARALAAAGADLLWIETQWDLAEARAALAAARGAGLGAVITFALREVGGGLEAPDGTPAPALLAAAAAAGALATGVNCVAPGAALARLAAWARDGLPVPLVAKPSPGLPGAVAAPAAFADAVRPALRQGLAIVGGCCGATAAHLRALGDVLASP
jgi:5-methyltetrahydrofolate--homocysteine methyltransferase